MVDVLREKSNDSTYLHAEFVKACLEENVAVPTGLAISLLEEKIEHGMKEGNNWTLVQGFPESMQQLCDFEGKVCCCLYMEGFMLILIGSKTKLRTAFEVLIKGSTAA